MFSIQSLRPRAQILESTSAPLLSFEVGGGKFIAQNIERDHMVILSVWSGSDPEASTAADIHTKTLSINFGSTGLIPVLLWKSEVPWSMKLSRCNHRSFRLLGLKSA